MKKEFNKLIDLEKQVRKSWKKWNDCCALQSEVVKLFSKVDAEFVKVYKEYMTLAKELNKTPIVDFDQEA